MRKCVFFLSLAMFQITGVILAEHCSLQMLLIYTAIDSLHIHTHTHDLHLTLAAAIHCASRAVLQI